MAEQHVRQIAKPTSDCELRVIVFSDAFRHRNGVGAYYCDLIEHLQERLGGIELICPGPTPEGEMQGLSLPLPGDPTQKLSIPGLPKAIRTIRRLKPSVVVVATPGPYGLLGLALAKVLRVPVVMGYHTQYDQLVSMYWNHVFGRIGAMYLRCLDRILFRMGAPVLTNSKPMVDAARDLGASEVRLVGTPIERRLLEDVTEHDGARFGPVLFVGRLAPEKNLEAVFDAARNLGNVPFLIAGDGPLGPEARAMAEELPNLEYLGWLDRPNLIQALDRSEILVLPSHVESFGTVAIEAMARQRLVLVSEHCGIRDWKELGSSLEVMGAKETLTDALRRVAALSHSERLARARTGHRQADVFNENTLSHWVAVLQQAAGRSVHASATVSAVREGSE